MIKQQYKIQDINFGLPSMNRVQLNSVYLDYINNKFTAICTLYNFDSPDFSLNISIELTEEEYNLWSDDDAYIIMKCFEKHNLISITQKDLQVIDEDIIKLKK